MDLTPVRRRSAAQAVFERLEAQILGRALTPGEALPSERALTEAFGVNRQAVREALSRLAQMGLVDIRHGGATTVRDFRRSGGLDLLAHLLVGADGAIDLAVVRSIMEMRSAIGPDIARLAAERGLPEQVAQLQRVVAELERTARADVEALAALDIEFWDVLTVAADNVAYQLALNGLRDFYRPIDAVVHEVLLDELADASAHAAVTDAVARADSAAAEAAARQLLSLGSVAMTEALAMRSTP
jgi:GntR family transcriptional repressor for pyruvate dehydrogenase complex